MTRDLHQKINPDHLKRNAYLYVRQSTMRQVLSNTESTKRQYQLREKALALGWKSEQIKIIDCDQAKSGAHMIDRNGFKELMTEVSMGKAGLVMGLEVSRLARNNADWHRLLEICAFSKTLILDQDGLYDTTSFNDRLLLGLKGAMSEAELHVLRGRLLQGILNKARRGELKIPLPSGFEYDELNRVVLSRDSRIRQVFKQFFAAFKRLGSATAVTKEFRREEIEMPHYSRTGPKSNQVIWGDLTHSQTLRILHNPRYAGAFSYGKTRSRKDPEGRVHHEKLPMKEWTALVRDAHPGYITWEDYEENERRLQENAATYGKNNPKTPPREGPALLQGIVICGICGKRMTVRYHKRRGKLTPDYICQRDKIEQAQTRECQHIPGSNIDKAIAKILVSMVNESNIDTALAVHDELQSRLEQADQIRQQQVARARYEVDLARRRYTQVDPEKRYVAEVLEAEWNEKLRLLDDAQTAYEKARDRDQQLLSEDQKNKLQSLATDFADTWNIPDMHHRDRKRIVRLLVEDVTLIKGDPTTAHIRFKGGKSTTLTIPLPQQAYKTWQTSPEVVTQVDMLLDEYTFNPIASILNKQGLRSGKGKPFNITMIGNICRDYNLKTRFDRLREKGLFTVKEMAVKLNTCTTTVKVWRRNGWLIGHAYNDRKECLFEDQGTERSIKYQRVKPFKQPKLGITPDHTKEVQYAT
ncbi:MAG: recombinase family protein [Desulforhopalus sp.]|nr:recombinase family protein [Desulforhopalus sp.]